MAAAHDIRFSTLGPIDDGNFETATPIHPTPTPNVQGTLELFVVDAPAETTVHFALRAADEISANSSPVSNSVAIVIPRVPP